MLKNIQTLRFLAAFWVVLYHMTPPVTPFRMTLLPQAVAQLGFAGVDIFFVVSGLIMAETTRGLPAGRQSAGRFILQRFGRIYIGWWPFFFIYLLALHHLGRMDPQKSLPGSFFLWPQSLEKYLLPVTWTLSFELYFYTIVALLVCWRRDCAARALFAVGVVIAALNAVFYAMGMYLPQNEILAKKFLIIPFYASPMVIEFIAGFLLSGFLRKRPTQWLFPWLVGAAASLAGAYCYQFYAKLHASGMAGFFHANERVLLLGTFAVCLTACALILERRGIQPLRLLQRLGDASYSIYLSHIMLIGAAGLIYLKLQGIAWWKGGNIWGVATLACVVGYAWGHFILVEQPLHGKLKRLVARLVRA